MTNEKRTTAFFVLLISIATLSIVYYLSAANEPNITGMHQTQTGKGTIKFNVVCGDNVTGTGEQCDPPGSIGQCPGGEVCTATCQCPRKPSGGGGSKASFERPCPQAHTFTKDGHQSGMLLLDYDPAVMGTDIVVMVLDNNVGDQLRAVFVDENCQKTTEVNLGEEFQNKIYTFKPSQYTDQPTKIFIQSVNQGYTVNNPLVGKIYFKGIAINLLGVMSRKDWGSTVEPADQLNFNNNAWARLPSQTLSTHAFPGEYEIGSIFEPEKTVLFSIGNRQASLRQACAVTIPMPEVTEPTLVRTEEEKIAIKSYNIGLGYGTGSYSGLVEGPDRTIYGTTQAGYPYNDPGIPDSRPQGQFMTVAAIKEYKGDTIEDWLVLTNIGDETTTYAIAYYDGNTCAQRNKDVTIQPKTSTIIKASELTKTTEPSRGIVMITAALGKRNLIVEKYGMQGNKPVYKLNALAPFKTSQETTMKRLSRDAAKRFVALVPTIQKNEDFDIQLINLAAIEKPERLRQTLKFRVTDGKNSWRSFELIKNGCIIDLTRNDLNEWAYQRTWLTHPEYIGIIGELNGPVYPSDVITIAENSPQVITNEPGFELGESFGTCCADSDCESRWGLRGWSCGYEEYYGENVCVPPEEKYAQASPAKEQPAPPAKEQPYAPPPLPEEPYFVTIPYTEYSFPWWYFALAAAVLLALSHVLYRKAHKPQKTELPPAVPEARKPSKRRKK